MNIDNKKDLILDAASQVFTREGFHKAKISKIAEIAGIGAGTVYLYFTNKEAILEELFVRSWSRIEAKLQNMRSIKNMTPKQKIKEILDEIVELAAGNASVAKMILYEYSFWSSGPSSKVNEIVKNSKMLIGELIEEGIACGDFNKQLSTDETTVFIIGGVWYFLAYKSDELEKGDVSALSDKLNQYIINGIS